MRSKHTLYVAGLLATEDGKFGVLIFKDHGPPPVVGRWNLVGGEAEWQEASATAMEREFVEETGVLVPARNWELGLELSVGYVGKGHNSALVHFYVSRADMSILRTARSMTKEEVKVHDLSLVPTSPRVVENLKWIVPLLLNPNRHGYAGVSELYR